MPTAAQHHGSRRAQAALLLIDLIQDYRFGGGQAMADAVAEMAPRVLDLRQRARAAAAPVIYCNDNFGRWRSDPHTVVERCAREGRLPARLLRELAPSGDDYFVLKPRHSAFHSTPLDVLLESLGTARLVLAGVATDSCILVTTAEAHMRKYALHVPRDCVAAKTRRRSRLALALMKASFSADTRPAARVALE